jgi:hypothetical protein
MAIVNNDDLKRILEAFERISREGSRDANVTTHADLGAAYLEMGLLSDAEAEFSRVLKMDPTHEPARAALELIKR